MASLIAKAKEGSRRFVLDPLEECLQGLPKATALVVEEKFSQVLPRLAQHFDGKALNDLKTANPWLAVFDPSSTSNWENAKSTFIKNGPACLDVLALFTDLIRSEALIGNMLERNVAFTTLLLLAILKKMEEIENRYDNPKKVAMQMGRWSDETDKEIAGEEKATVKGRVEVLLNNRFTAEEVNKSHNVRYRSEVG